MSDHTTTIEEEEYEEVSYGRLVAIAAVVAIVLAAGAFFAGKALAGGGPATLADAVKQAQAGTLPCGDTGAAPTQQPQGGATPGANSDFLVRAVCDRGANGQGGGYFGGRGTGAQGQGGRFGGGLFGPGSQTGQVAGVSGSNLTLSGGPQGSRTVKLGSATKVTKSTSGSLSDLKAGDTVIVSGLGQDGSGTATNIFILPSSSGQ